MVILIKYVFALFVFRCSGYALAQVPAISPDVSYELQEIDDFIVASDWMMNGTLHQTVKRYRCAWPHADNSSQLLLYGSKSWIFPNQDVKLDLSYPVSPINGTLNVLVSRFDVILRIDGKNSKGYITEGGILQEWISLSFVFNNISSLDYEFWLYGMPRATLDRLDTNQYELHKLC